MTTSYRVFGAELSPYSIKVRSYFRYKELPHEWLLRSAATEAEFQQYAKLPLVPLVLCPDGIAMQDSTPIIERLEERHPEPPLQPADPTLAFLSALIEEYADEWGNKPMFHYRWTYEADQESAAQRIAHDMMPGVDADAVRAAAQTIKTRMVPRLAFVGSSPATLDVIEASFHRQLAILERHLDGRPFLFGGRPTLGDLGLYAQLYQCASDPTPGAIMRARAPRTLAWTEHMLTPRAQGDLETWGTLGPTLLPLLRDEVGAVFLPWSTANARAIANGEKTFSVELGGKPFSQETQKYHAKSLAALRARYAAVAERAALDGILREAGCLSWLQ
ncbi:MAG TPA: glutathione S-transferase family protein [Candidatus Binatia bacterium]|jgi:glutathione S-transferase